MVSKHADHEFSVLCCFMRFSYMGTKSLPSRCNWTSAKRKKDYFNESKFLYLILTYVIGVFWWMRDFLLAADWGDCVIYINGVEIFAKGLFSSRSSSMFVTLVYFGALETIISSTIITTIRYSISSWLRNGSSNLHPKNQNQSLKSHFCHIKLQFFILCCIRWYPIFIIII